MTPNTDSNTQKPTKDNSQDLLRAELTDVVRQQLGMQGPEAIQTAEALLRGLMMRLGGQKVYIPLIKKSDRAAEILSDFNGRNISEVCATHGISRRTLYYMLGATLT